MGRKLSIIVLFFVQMLLLLVQNHAEIVVFTVEAPAPQPHKNTTHFAPPPQPNKNTTHFPNVSSSSSFAIIVASLKAVLNHKNVDHIAQLDVQIRNTRNRVCFSPEVLCQVLVCASWNLWQQTGLPLLQQLEDQKRRTQMPLKLQISSINCVVGLEVYGEMLKVQSETSIFDFVTLANGEVTGGMIVKLYGEATGGVVYGEAIASMVVNLYGEAT
ncbi:hypothetical protein V8G54_021897, partial [Vigna mungo]